jgi:serine/threonine protein phosphatase PrpC
MKIDVIGKTDVGRVRDHNEDSFAVLIGEDAPVGTDALLIVADGMGGHAAGEVASQMAVEQFMEIFKSQCAEFVDATDAEYASLCGVVLKDVNHLVWEAGQIPGQIGMGTTFTAAVLKGKKLFICHVGDSRAYLLTEGVFSQITKDHSWIEDAVVAGILTREEARIHPNKNVLTRAVGLDEDVEVDRVVRGVDVGDRLLLCSDGLNAMVPDSEIETIVSQNPKELAVEKLINAANGQGGNDNVTVIATYMS